MTITVGQTLPEATFTYVPYDSTRDPKVCGRPIPYALHKELKGKKAIIFSIPGAFTPTCSEQHVPEFLKEYDTLKGKGVDVIICVAVNDAFVMDAFSQHLGAEDKIIMASDGGSDFFESLGLTLDLTKMGMGVRSKRFALVVDDLVVKYVGVDDSGVDQSGPNGVLTAL